MNNVDILVLEQQKADKLRSYGLDSKSIDDFKSKIKEVSLKEKETLGRELF